MIKRVKYFVSPKQTNNGLEWQVKKSNAERANKQFENKDDAIRLGKDLAKKPDLGQLIILGKDGKIQTEYTYGKDPEEYKG